MWPDEWFQSVGVGTRTRWLGPKTLRSQPMWPHKCHITCRCRKRESAGKNQTAVSWQFWSIKWSAIIRCEVRLASSEQKQFCPGTYWWLDWATGNRTESFGPHFSVSYRTSRGQQRTPSRRHHVQTPKPPKYFQGYVGEIDWKTSEDTGSKCLFGGEYCGGTRNSLLVSHWL